MEPQKAWSCSLCSWVYKTQKGLERHMKTHSKEKAYPCKECEKEYTTVSGLKLHMRVHTGEKPHACDTCGKAFASLSVLVMHQRSHTKEKPYVCKICGSSYTQSSSLSHHMHMHSNTVYDCKLCNKQFSTIDRYIYHKKNVHYKVMCGFCKKKFRSKEGLVKHGNCQAGGNMYYCDYCGIAKTNKSILANHIKTHTQEEVFKCKLCDKIFYSTPSLNAHHRSRHKKEQCVHCLKVVNISSMKKHLTTHEERENKGYFKRFMCMTCGTKILYAKDFATHKKLCPISDQVNSFSCDFCLGKFKSYEELKGHVRKHIAEKNNWVSISDGKNPSWVVKKALWKRNYATFKKLDSGQSETEDKFFEKFGCDRNRSNGNNGVSKDVSEISQETNIQAQGKKITTNGKVRRKKKSQELCESNVKRDLQKMSKRNVSKKRADFQRSQTELSENDLNRSSGKSQSNVKVEIKTESVESSQFGERQTLSQLQVEDVSVKEENMTIEDFSLDGNEDLAVRNDVEYRNVPQTSHFFIDGVMYLKKE